MVYLTKQFKLFGTTITVTETYEGEFEDQREIIEENIIINPFLAELQPEHNSMPPEILTVIQAMGGVLLTEKTLKKADVSLRQNRFHVKITEELLNLLTDEEKTLILDRQGSISVAAIDPRFQSYNMRLKMWKSMEATKKLVLISEWGKLVQDNGLEEGDFVELWGVRVNNALGFAVNIRNQ